MCLICDLCQKLKKTERKYNHIPEKETETEPWNELCVDLIGPYTIKKIKKTFNIVLCNHDRFCNRMV